MGHKCLHEFLISLSITKSQNNEKAISFSITITSTK